MTRYEDNTLLSIMISKIGDIHFQDSNGYVDDFEVEELIKSQKSWMFDDLIRNLKPYGYRVADTNFSDDPQNGSWVSFFNQKEMITLTMYPKYFNVAIVS